MYIPATSAAQSDDYTVDLTDLKGNSGSAPASGVGVPLNRHQVTITVSGTGTLSATIKAKATGTSAFEDVANGNLTIAAGEQKSGIIKDAYLDAIKIETGVLTGLTYTVKYVGSGDYRE